MDPRAPLESEIDPLAELWRASWHDGHAGLLPAAIVRQRTLEDFTGRLRSNLANVRVSGSPGAPSGLCIVRDDELDQLFVSASARGMGVAAALLADAEARIAAHGVRTGWLACAIGNDRAARFYEKHGWRRTGTTIKQVQTDEGEVGFDVWRYEKDVKGADMQLGAFSISLAVKDIAASRAFYEKFGFKAFGGDASKNWLILKNGDHVIGLFQGMFEKNMLTFNPGWDSNANPVGNFTDVRELQRRLKAQGVALMSEADESTSGPGSFMAIDPDGNPLLVDQHV